MLRIVVTATDVCRICVLLMHLFYLLQLYLVDFVEYFMFLVAMKAE